MSDQGDTERPLSSPRFHNESSSDFLRDGSYGHGNDENDSMSITQLLSSEEWSAYFTSLSETLRFQIEVYDEAGHPLLAVGENPFCQVMRSAEKAEAQCPKSCIASMMTAIESKRPAIYQCAARMQNFAIPLEQGGERAIIVGRGGFDSYVDLLTFLESARKASLPKVPVTLPLRFFDKTYVKAVAQYVKLSVERVLRGRAGERAPEEKHARMLALFDSQAFQTLAKNGELLNRYVLDTIEFVLGPSSTFIMERSRPEGTYEVVYGTGKYREVRSEIALRGDHPLIRELISRRGHIFSADHSKLETIAAVGAARSIHLFPIFVGDGLEKIIGISDKDLGGEDMRIMNAFRGYIQLNLDNQSLRAAMGKSTKLDEKLQFLSDFSHLMISIVDQESLYRTVLEKSLQLVHAEQGSLMIMDRETSDFVVEATKARDDTVKEKMRVEKGQGIVSRVLESGESLLVNDIETDPRIGRENRARYKTKSFISALIRVDDRITGVLNVSDKAEGKSFDEDDFNIVQSFMNNAGIAIERSLLYRERDELQRLSITDPLTGIYNRRYLNSRLSEEITRYNRYKHPFSFMMLDLDKFKEYNDTFGHIAGDRLIKVLAAVVEKSLRNIDIAARFGGDEFVAVFPQTPKVDAIQITNRLKEHVDEALSEHSKEMHLTISMGLSTYPDDASSIGELLEKTDQALYLAKKGGGNRVVYL